MSNTLSPEKLKKLEDDFATGSDHAARKAFDALYRMFNDQVLRFAYWRVGGHELAKDMAAEAWVRALERRHHLQERGGDAFVKWLTTILRNLIADHYKSSKVRREVLAEEFHDCDDALPGVDEEVLARFTRETLLAAIAGLNPEQQACILLRFHAERSVAETAAAMDKNEGAVKTMQYRAIQTLRRKLPEKDHL